MPNKSDQVIASIEQLRPMPGNVTRAIKALEAENPSVTDIASLIGLDQALTASVIQTANSVVLGFSVNCTSLRDAVMRIGFRRLKTLLLGAAVSGPLSRRLNGYRLGDGKLWDHSLATGMAAQWIAQAVRYPKPEEAYVAGLLHDMGKLLLDQFIQLDYQRVYEAISVKQRCLWEVEEELIGIDHPKVGSLMAEKWQFPEILTDAILYHHAPSLSYFSDALTSIVNIANSFSAPPDDSLMDVYGHTVHPEAMRILGVNDTRVADWQTAFWDNVHGNQH
jgi:putative nucleotidyltransferase with HDIG domain